MNPDLALFLYGVTFVAEGPLWLWHKLRPNAGPIFAG